MGKEDSFDSYFQVIVYHRGKVKVGAVNHKLHPIHRQEQREMNTHVIACLPVLSSVPLP